MSPLSHVSAIVPFGPTWAHLPPAVGQEARCWRLLTLSAHLAAAAASEALESAHRHDALAMAHAALHGAWQAWRLWGEALEGQDQCSAEAVAVFQGSDDLCAADAALGRLRDQLGRRPVPQLLKTGVLVRARAVAP